MLYLPGGAILFLTDVDYVSFEKANETRQNNLQSATVSLQVVIGLCKRKETAALKSKPPLQMGVSIWLLYDGFFSFAVVWQFLNQHDRLLVGSAAYPIRIESCHALIVPIHRLRYEKPIFDVLQGLLIFGNVWIVNTFSDKFF